MAVSALQRSAVTSRPLARSINRACSTNPALRLAGGFCGLRANQRLCSGSEAGDWQSELAVAIANTNNFVIDDMNIFTNPSKFDPLSPNPHNHTTHWEMDYIIMVIYSCT